MEKILSYPRLAGGSYDGVPQQYSWDCGPASAQVILAAAGIQKSEDWLIRQIGTTTDGTNHSGLITPILNSLLPGSGYTVKWLTTDPPTQTQVDQLFADIRRSIDGNRGAILNFVSPPWFRPKASYTSTESLQYRGGSTIFHYVAAMGYAIDDAGERHIWLADPGFRPHGMWCKAADVARLVVPHSYAYAATATIVVSEPSKPETKPVQPQPQPQPDLTNRNDRLWHEWNALQFADFDSIGVIVKAAGAGDSRAQLVLAKLEQTNPAALQQFISRKAA